MDFYGNKKIYINQIRNYSRILNPDDISLPPGYRISVFAQGLNTPISIAFTREGDILVADSGSLTGNAQVLLLKNGETILIAEGFNVPITGVTYRNGEIYVSHKGVITIVSMDGSKRDIIMGLPSYGDHSNNKVTFGRDDKMYFGQGTATNSGVVGLDNPWIFQDSYFHDYPGSYVMLNGQNFITENVLVPAGGMAYTGAFSPYGVPNLQRFEILKGSVQASGSLLRANPDGSNLELVAWGFRNPIAVNMDRFNRLFVANQGYDNRGSRPIANAPDELQLIIPGTWYGWPDYAGGEPITLPRFSPERGPKPEFLFTNHPTIPPRPFSVFPPHSRIMGFDINMNELFGPVGDIYISEFGSVGRDVPGEYIRSGVGHRVSRVDINTGQVFTFAINRSGFPSYIIEGGGFSRPVDAHFGPDGALYVVDFAITAREEPDNYIPGTGVIWRIEKS